MKKKPSPLKGGSKDMVKLYGTETGRYTTVTNFIVQEETSLQYFRAHPELQKWKNIILEADLEEIEARLVALGFTESKTKRKRSRI